MSYIIHRAYAPPALDGAPDSPEWSCAAVASVDCFRAESGDFRPRATCRLLYDRDGIYGLFEVNEQHVKATAERFNDQVCRDSCVEFFVTPNILCGYCNFEFSANGVMLAYHIRDARRIPGGFADFRPLSENEVAGVRVFHTLSGTFDIDAPTNWRLGFFLPFDLLCGACRSARPETGSIWRGNFFKCGDATKYPHWASHFPLHSLNFHLPECFGKLVFA